MPKKTRIVVRTNIQPHIFFEFLKLETMIFLKLEYSNFFNLLLINLKTNTFKPIANKLPNPMSSNLVKLNLIKNSFDIKLKTTNIAVNRLINKRVKDKV